jgi:hypothetical protein
MADIVASRKLREAQPVANVRQAQCFGVDGNNRTEVEAVRQITFVEFDFHAMPISLTPAE